MDMISSATSRRFKVTASHDCARLIDFLAEALSISKKKAKAILNRRDVFVNDRRVWMARHALRFGDRVEVLLSAGTARLPSRPAEGSGQAGPDGNSGKMPGILFQDKYFVIVNKRPGLLTCGANSLESELQTRLGLPELAAVHRLDKDTSGCVIFALCPAAYDRMLPLFRQHQVRKQYHAIAARMMWKSSGTIRKTLSGQKSVTHAKVLDANKNASHLLIDIETGRTHQIRRHLASIRHPVVGDRRYGTGVKLCARSREVARQMLHASELQFVHPFTNRTIHFVSPLPDDFRKCLRSYGLK